MKHRQFHAIMQLSDAQLDAYAAERKLDLPEQFCCSTPTRSKAEYICNALGLQDPDGDEDDEGDALDPYGSALDKLARDIQREHPDWSYESCLGEARKRHPELARKYAESFPSGVSAGRRKKGMKQ